VKMEMQGHLMTIESMAVRVNARWRRVSHALSLASVRRYAVKVHSIIGSMSAMMGIT
jgi:hypothetical protein